MTVMNKPELIAKIAEETGESKAATERFLNAFQKTVVDSVADKVEVKISGFVAFTPTVRAERKTTTPISGAEIVVPAHDSVKVRILKHFKDRLSGNDE